MFSIKKKFEISAAHRLALDYESKCHGLHGHNWIIWVHYQQQQLNQNGMILDFHAISEEFKTKIHDKLDHQYLNEVLTLNPTAENMARWICEQMLCCCQVDVQESEGNIASYMKD